MFPPVLDVSICDPDNNLETLEYCENVTVTKLQNCATKVDIKESRAAEPNNDHISGSFRWDIFSKCGCEYKYTASLMF